MRQDAIYKLAKANLSKQVSEKEINKKASSERLYKLAKVNISKQAGVFDSLSKFILMKRAPRTVIRNSVKGFVNAAMKEERTKTTKQLAAMAEQVTLTQKKSLRNMLAIGGVAGISGLLGGVSLAKKDRQLPQYQYPQA